MTEETIRQLMRYRELSKKEATAYWNTGSPRIAVLTAQEIAELVAFILSGKAPYLSGAQLELAGGQR